MFTIAGLHDGGYNFTKYMDIEPKPEDRHELKYERRRSGFHEMSLSEKLLSDIEKPLLIVSGFIILLFLLRR